MTLVGLKQIGLRHRRKLLVIASITLAILAIGGYILWSMNVWTAYKTSYENWQKELRTSVNVAIALPVASAPERAKKMSAFKDVSTKINAAQQSLCKTPALITWQHTIDSLRQSEETCGRIISGAEAFGKKMQATTVYLEKEQALAAVISATLTASEGKITEATWGSQVATWQDASKNIAKISSTESSFTSVKTSALEKVKSVESAWQELIAAHTAKDKAKYLEAQGKLAAAYDTLSSLSSVSADQLTKLATSLQTAYSQTFNITT